jgi:hypothetical protein
VSDTDLSHSLKEGFGSIHRRIDDFISVTQHRHQEILSKVEVVSQDVGSISDRLTRVETRVDTIVKPGRNGSDNGHISLTELKWYLAIAGGAVTATFGVLKALGKL